MRENETVTRYYAVIRDGDQYHKEGEEHLIPSGFLDDVKEHGLRLKVRENKWDTIYHFYPVYIKKKVYRLDLIEIESMPGGDRDKYRKWGETIGYDKVDKKEYDWKEHWP